MLIARPLPFFLILAAGAALSPLHGEDAAPASPARTLLRQIDQGFIEVFEKVAPTVVVVEANKQPARDGRADLEEFDFLFRNPKGGGQEPRFRMPDPPNRSEGSGFIIRPDGFILTNSHVIADALNVVVKLKDGRSFPAKVVGADDKTDIALLKIDSKNLPTAEVGDSDALRVGQLVCAIGIPYNLDYSFTCGWVSAKGRSNLTNTTYEDYIQTDAFINPGNSGGPLFDIDGRVVGMNTLINGIGRGLAFAIPSNMFMDVAGQLISTGKIVRPWLGIRIETLGENASLREHLQGVARGVVVDTIEPDAPAYKSDLRPADVITQVDGVDLATARDLQKEILKKRVGQPVELTVWRGGKSLRIPIITGELPSDVTKVANNAEPKPPTPPEARGNAFGFQVQNLTKELAERLKTTTTRGALVTDVTEGSAAAAADIQREDVITEVDQKPVTSADSLKSALSKREPGRAVLLFIERKGQRTYAVLKPEK